MKNKLFSYDTKVLNYNQVTRGTHRFMEAEIAIMYEGDNRNYTSIQMNAIEKALSSIHNIPVIGEFDKENNSFKGHGGETRITDDGVEYIDTTKAYGFVPHDAKLEWREIQEPSGKVREYLVVSPVVLWNERYSELNILNESPVGQSMEIFVNDGYEREDGFFEITDFTFHALCLLGVEPAFEGSHAKIFELESQEKEFNEMISIYEKYARKEDNKMNVEQLLAMLKEKYSEKYNLESLTVEMLTEKVGEEVAEDYDLDTLVSELELEEIKSTDDEPIDYEALYNETLGKLETANADLVEYEAIKNQLVEVKKELEEIRNDFTELTAVHADVKTELEQAQSTISEYSEFKEQFEAVKKEQGEKKIFDKILEYSTVLGIKDEDVSNMVEEFSADVDFTNDSSVEGAVEKVEKELLVRIGRSYVKSNKDSKPEGKKGFAHIINKHNKQSKTDNEIMNKYSKSEGGNK